MKRRAIFGVLVVVSMLGAVLSTAPSAEATPRPKRILIYGPTLFAKEGRVSEATIARHAGYRVVVADAGRWGALSTADFQAFDAIVVPDHHCSGNLSLLDTAVATAATWSAAVDGPVIVAGNDPVWHINFSGSRGARKFMIHVINSVANGSGTGLYFSLSCLYSFDDVGTAVDALAGLGTFTVQGQGVPPLPGCPNKLTIVDATNPAMIGLTDADLSNWGCSAHEGFDSYPAGFEVLVQMSKSAVPIVIARSAVATVTVAPIPPSAGSSSAIPTARNPNRT